MAISNQPKALIEFKKMTHGFHTAYCMANASMASYADEIANIEGINLDGVFQIGERVPHRQAWSEIPTRTALEGMQKDGPMSQLVAHGMIVWIYALWENDFRRRVADELGVLELNKIKCDVMGDVRILRQWIVHCGAIADRDVKRIKVLEWARFEGPLCVTSREMTSLQIAINLMTVSTTL